MSKPAGPCNSHKCHCPRCQEARREAQQDLRIEALTERVTRLEDCAARKPIRRIEFDLSHRRIGEVERTDTKIIVTSNPVSDGGWLQQRFMGKEQKSFMAMGGVVKPMPRFATGGIKTDPLLRGSWHNAHVFDAERYQAGGSVKGYKKLYPSSLPRWTDCPGEYWFSPAIGGSGQYVGWDLASKEDIPIPQSKEPERTMSPLLISMMLHFYACAERFSGPSFNSPAYRAGVQKLYRLGLIERTTAEEFRAHPGWDFKATEKGGVYVGALKAVPMPVQTEPEWVMPS